MSFDYVRRINFIIPGVHQSPGVRVIATEVDGALEFTVNVLNGKKQSGDLRGLFFDFNAPAKLSGLESQGALVTDFMKNNVANLGNGSTMKGAINPYDIGLEFGTPGKELDNIKSATFTLSNSSHDLTLDDIANVQFGARLTGVGTKLEVVAPAAPDAIDDSYRIFEDGVSGLNAPSTVPTGQLFEILVNDTDADGDTLTIIDVKGAQHGTVQIVDGADADTLPGDAVLYTPFEDYSGTDSFMYLISDNNGGTDFASVNVAIEAVADIPDLTYEILEGAAVNQIIVRVTATQTDADSSEFIDRIVLDGIPGEVVGSESIYNPTIEPDQIVRDFVLTVPMYLDASFDLSVTAVAKETSNGDEETASASISIIYDTNMNDFAPIFDAEDQSMWASGDAWSFNDDRFLGTSGGPDGRLSASIGVGSAYADYDLNYKFGLQSTLNIGSGEVDATIPYSVNVQTLYNETTDWLRFETDAAVELGQSEFSTQSPLLTYTLDLIAQFQSALTLGASIDIPGIPGVPAAYVEGFQVTPEIPGIPGWSWGGSTSVSGGFDTSFNLLEFDGDSLNLMGLEGDSAASYDLGYGLAIELEIPHFTTDSQVAGDHLESEGSANFVSLVADVDEILSLLLGYPNLLGQSVSFGPATVGYDLLNYELAGSLGVGQEFSLSFGNLNGVLKFEDDTEYNFVLGDDFDVKNASTHDSNQDGELDFSLTLTPDATFSSNLLLTMELTHALDLLDAYLSVSVPVFDDPEFHLGPLYSYGDTLASTSVELVGFPGFAFDLGNTTEMFIV